MFYMDRHCTEPHPDGGSRIVKSRENDAAVKDIVKSIFSLNCPGYQAFKQITDKPVISSRERMPSALFEPPLPAPSGKASEPGHGYLVCSICRDGIRAETEATCEDRVCEFRYIGMQSHYPQKVI